MHSDMGLTSRISVNFSVAVGIALFAMLFISDGCSYVTSSMHKSWHRTFNWKAEDYFDDPYVVAVCHAIEANDLREMERLIAAGADINAKGKENMTPLLWAYPDNQLGRFKLLLEKG